MRKITIEDISRHTGLSRGTVSRALNDRPDISAQTKQRVLEACNQLRYVPSHAARSLATGRRYAVAIVVDDLRSTYAGAFLRGVVNRARRERYAVLVSELGADSAAAIEPLRALVNERVDAVLFATPIADRFAEQLFEHVAERPIVTAAPLERACDVMAPDYAEAGRLAARYLLNQTREILYVHEPGAMGADQRRDGFLEVCREADLDTGRMVVEGTHGPDGLAALRERLGPARAVAAASDFLALQLMFLCYQSRRTPGRDVAVIGQGNELAGALVQPALTTIDFAGEEIGQRAMDLVLQRVAQTRQDSPQQTYVPPVLVERESGRLSS
jgi:LacI family transcriptional regulator